MGHDEDCQRAARHLRELHGTGAAEVARKRAEQLNSDGSLEAAKIWQKIFVILRQDVAKD